ncbi:MAG: alpha/beta hydrolase [Sphingomonas sp.]|nr:alpha/beta hydrolase [Sphingomonas sp.]
MIDINAIDPELRAALEQSRAGRFADQSFEQARDGMDAMLAKIGPLVDPALFERVSVNTRDRAVTGQLYRPTERKERDPLPVMLWFHGGGFFMGRLSNGDPMCLDIANRSGCAVLSVNYRLIPEHPYPAAIDDAVAMLVWAQEQASALGLDAGRLAVGGASAGGCIAAALALRARDQGLPPIRFQLLMIPVIDNRLETPSALATTDPRVWNRDLSQRSWQSYLSNITGDVPGHASPARAADLSGLPPAFISVEEHDLLRDEGIDYARRLMQAGVTTELHCYPGTYHGSFAFTPQADVSQRHMGDAIHALAKAMRCESTPA